LIEKKKKKNKQKKKKNKHTLQIKPALIGRERTTTSGIQLAKEMFWNWSSRGVRGAEQVSQVKDYYTAELFRVQTI